MNSPLVSVIMPAYNAEKYIEEAIRSVMVQTVTDWELIVIDDCSTDGTRDVIKSLCGEEPRIRYFQNEANMGVAKTRNCGFRLAHGQYIALLDSDDFWRADKLETQLAMLCEEEADLCFSSYALVGANNEKVRNDYLVPRKVSFESMLKENFIGCSTVLMSARLAKKYAFNTGFYHEDYELWLRLLRDGNRAVGCTETLASWRYVEDSRSFNKINSAKNRWAIYRKQLGLPIGKSLALIGSYALAGLRKYGRVS